MQQLEENEVGAKRIADALRDQIVAGERPPGTRIGQVALAEQFETSRMPVREALRLLEAEGLVVIESHRGAWVSKLDFEEFRQSYQLRAAIEPLAIAESLPNLSGLQIDELFLLQRRLVQATEEEVDVVGFLELDREFHLLTYAGVTFAPLSEMITRLWNSTQHFRRSYVSGLRASDFATTHADHLLIADAIRRGDAVSAADVLRMHIRRTSDVLSRDRSRFE